MSARARSVATAGALVAALASVMGAPAAVGAQSVEPSCAASRREAQDACQKAVDLVAFLLPQVGGAIAGGNATLGQGGALNGLGHLAAGLRVTVVDGGLPHVVAVRPALGGPVASDYRVLRRPVLAPAADVAVGLFRGLPVSITNVLAVDALASVFFVQGVAADGVRLSVAKDRFRLGYGLRVGVLQESLLTPGIAVTYLRRDVPTTNIGGVADGAELNVRNLDVRTDAWRAVVGKNLLVFGLAAGVGRDRYRAAAAADARVTTPLGPVAAGPVAIARAVTRTSVFLDASLNLAFARVVGEIGRTSGSPVPTFNTFGGRRAGGALTYASLGGRFGL